MTWQKTYPDSGRRTWVIIGGTVLALHVIAAWAFSQNSSKPPVTAGAAPVVTLAEFVAAPAPKPSVAQQAAEPAKPKPQPEPRPEPEPEPPDPIPAPEPKPEPVPKVEQEVADRPEEETPDESNVDPDQVAAQESIASEQQAKEAQSIQAKNDDSQRVTQQKASWEGQLAAHLERHKRYPYMARNRREEGTVVLRFTVNRRGEVLESELEKKSGYFLLDREVQAMLKRAQPLPKPPRELRGRTIEVILPIEFALR